MAGEIAIRASGVGKSFRGTGRATSLKERILRMGHGTAEPFQALRDVGYDDWLTFECRLRGRPEEALPVSTRFLRGFLDG